MEFLEKNQLVRGGVYTVYCRNLAVGVYDGDEGFIGIREKFGDEYLFTEYLRREQGGTQIGCDTAGALELIGHVPDGIELVEMFRDDETGGWRNNKKLQEFLAPLDEAERKRRWPN